MVMRYGGIEISRPEVHYREATLWLDAAEEAVEECEGAYPDPPHFTDGAIAMAAVQAELAKVALALYGGA